MIVLDSSAFFSMDGLPQEGHVCPPGVIRELERYKDPRLELWGDMINVMDCSQGSLNKVREAAARTGDIGRLSPVDLTVLALAVDVGGTIWSDDYSIQNVASVMGIGFRAVGMKGIKKTFRWKYRCVGCGKRYNESMPDCPICGSQLKSCRRRSGEQALAPDELVEPALAEEAHAHGGAALGPEREHVGQLLVEGGGPQRPVHYAPPLGLVVLQGRGRPDVGRRDGPAYAPRDHG